MKLSRTGTMTGLVLTGALSLAACGSDNNNTASTSASGSASSSASAISCATGSVTASGSSAQKNAMDEWVAAYQEACKGSTINYQGVGSGAGRQAFIAKTVAFAGSDSSIPAADQATSDARCATGKAINLPMVTGPVAIAYNLQGVDGLVLDAPTIAKIFSGKITSWDDAAIKALNSSAKLPSTPIQAFHRNDDSGTTDNFQKYLTAAAPADWTFAPGQKFGAPGGQSAAKSDGVTQAVTSTAGAITYVELSFAQNAKLGIAKLATGAKNPVELSADTAGKAVETAKIAGTGNDLKLTLDYATKVDGAYPLILVTYEIVCEKGTPADALPLVKGFLEYTASAKGQGVLSGLGYAPLPDSIRSKVATAAAALS